MDTGLTSDFIANIRDEIAVVDKYVAEGKCQSFDKYKQKTGYRAGLQRSLEVLHETIRHITEIQDLEDEEI